MCGIFGWVGEGAAQRPPLEDMARRLRHRGPDDLGFFTAPGVGIGMVRLAIVDLASGRQPMNSPDGRFVIVFNGEIYNHLELRQTPELSDYPFATRSDTETLLAAYTRLGAACLARLNGMFAFAVWDTLAQTLFLARDRFGVKPLYWTRRQGAFGFASEARALLAPRPRPDMTALAQYLQLGYVPPPFSPFEGLSKFPAGHCAVVDADGNMRQTRWFVPGYGQGVAPDAKSLTHELAAKLDAAVSRELLGDVPIGLFLSGGLDSSLVAAFAARHSPGIRAFAVSFTETTHDEGADAALAARHLGLPLETLRLSCEDIESLFDDVAGNLDEPFADSTVLPLLAISRLARTEVKATLTGWGGDEVFMGYPTLLAHRLARYYRRLPGPVRRLAPWAVSRLPVSDAYMSLEFKARRFLLGMGESPERQHLAWMGYFPPEGVGAMLTAPARELAGDVRGFLDGVVSGLSGGTPMDRILELDTRLFLEGNGLFQADRMTMLASLEARVPLLNPELTDFVNALPWQTKMPGLELKRLLRRVAEPLLPESLLRKPKKGFGPPTAQWIRGPLAAKVRQTLEPGRLAASGVIDPVAAARLLAEHEARTSDHGRQIWALVSLQCWLERFCPRGLA